MMKIVTIVIACMMLSCCARKPKQVAEDALNVLPTTVQKEIEAAYFEGQRDALDGDVRISWTGSEWIWTKSPGIPARSRSSILEQ